MTGPDAGSPADRAEQAVTADGRVPSAAEPDVPLEAPAADVVEQAQAVAPGTSRSGDVDLPLEADDLDAAEQATVVDGDDEERR